VIAHWTTWFVQAGSHPCFECSCLDAYWEFWDNYPEFPAQGTDKCPAEESWGLDLWAKSAVPGTLGVATGNRLVLNLLDDTANPLNQKARGHAIDPIDDGLLPASFSHSRGGCEIKP